jgi:hypothetical protein
MHLHGRAIGQQRGLFPVLADESVLAEASSLRGFLGLRWVSRTLGFGSEALRRRGRNSHPSIFFSLLFLAFSALLRLPVVRFANRPFTYAWARPVLAASPNIDSASARTP